MEPSHELVREFKLKSELSLLCNRKLKEYARKKVSNSHKTAKMVPLLEAFIREKVLSYRYAILLSIVFSKEFEEIRSRVLNGSYSLAHISHEDYWAKHGSNIMLPDAIFFSYTFYCEAYPTANEVISLLSERLEKKPELDVICAIEQLIY